MENVNDEKKDEVINNNNIVKETIVNNMVNEAIKEDVNNEPVNNVNNNKNDSNSSGLMGFLVVLILLLLVGGGYFVYDYFFAKNDNASVKEDVKEEKKEEKKVSESDEVSDEVKILLLNKIDDYNKYISKFYSFNNVSSIDNQYLLNFAYSLAGNEKTSNNLDKVISAYFDDNVKLKHEDIICKVDDVALYKYNASTKKYELNEKHPGHGGVSGVDVEKVFLGGINMGDSIVISTKNFYFMPDDVAEGIKYYASYNDVLNGENKVCESSTEFDKYKDKLPTTTYTFVKNSSSEYVLSSVSIEDKVFVSENIQVNDDKEINQESSKK